MTFVKTLTVGTFLAATLATGAFAKGHNQGMSSTTSETPGTDVYEETVKNSHTEGEEQGNRPADKGPQNTPASQDRGQGRN